MTEALYRQRGIRYKVIEGLTKTDLYLRFASLLPGKGEAPKINLPDDERLIFQFLSLKRKVSVHGNESIDAMKDLNGDSPHGDPQQRPSPRSRVPPPRPDPTREPEPRDRPLSRTAEGVGAEARAVRRLLRE
jgi:hypothetical protein